MAFEIGVSPNVLVQAQSKGSACCVWRDGLRSYVLSASHVLEGLPESSDVQWMSASGDLGLGETVAPSLYWMSSQGGALDAGLASISTAGPFGVSTGYPWGNEVMPWDAIDSVRSVIICGKNGQRFATFDAKVPAGQFFSNHIHGRLLRFRYDTAETAEGDSGAAIISLPEGMLVGMHVARDLNPRFSLAVAADDIQRAFEKRLPGFRLRP